jgi:hypothetical protein
MDMVELFPNIDDTPLPEATLCPAEHIDAALAEELAASVQSTKNGDQADGVPLLLLETQMQQQQQ